MIVQTKDRGALGVHEVEMIVKDWEGEKRGEGRWWIEMRRPKVKEP